MNCVETLKVLKHAQAQKATPKSAIYWTHSPADNVVETACAFNDGKLAAASFDGSSKPLAASSCAMIYSYFTKDDSDYWVKNDANEGVKVHCVRCSF
jgi:hypothetical protein